jgi:hypothetical protein
MGILIYIVSDVFLRIYSYFTTGEFSPLPFPPFSQAGVITIALVFARMYPFIDTVELVNGTLRLKSPYITTDLSVL